MLTVERGTLGSEILDWIRGLAAMAVVIMHFRLLFWVDYDDVADPSLILTAGYALTALGHQAVIVFFVLSGYFVGGSVLDRRAAGRWTWHSYVIARFARLYPVLLVAVGLTVGLDALGLKLWGHATYRNMPGLGYDVRSTLNPSSTLASLSFTQTVAAPPVGSNAPLWSLANEWWYYIVFPLLLPAFRTWKLRLLSLLAGAAILLLIGSAIASYFLVWLLGVGAGYAARPLRLRPRTRCMLSVASVGALCASLYLGRGMPQFPADLLLGLATAAFVATIVALPRRSCSSTLGAWLASFSYTLYLVHLPFAMFLRAAAWDGPERLQPSAWSAGVLGLGTVAAYVLAIGTAALVEQRTSQVRRALLGAWAALSRSPP